MLTTSSMQVWAQRNKKAPFAGWVLVAVDAAAGRTGTAGREAAEADAADAFCLATVLVWIKLEVGAGFFIAGAWDTTVPCVVSRDGSTLRLFDVCS